MTPLLRVSDLRVTFSLQGAPLHAVRGISFEVGVGETVGIVGESGCGKSTAMQAITGLTPATCVEGEVFFEGVDLLKTKVPVLGTKIGMVFQDPMTCLNPTMRIGAQITEGMLYHRLANRKTAEQRALELLQFVGVNHPQIRFRQYPHQLSGGMRQRVLIAIALSCFPKLLIADEPTTALDKTLQTQILDLLKQLQKHFQMSLILISHDLSVVARSCQRVLVLYAGKIVEQGTAKQVLCHPKHPYTQMLLESLPHFKQARSDPLCIIEGSPPSLMAPIKGCAFRARCPYAVLRCEQEDPPFFDSAACWRCQ